MFAPKIDNDLFQSTLPRGSDGSGKSTSLRNFISIHAPSRERRLQNTSLFSRKDFNPRSLAGAT